MAVPRQQIVGMLRRAGLQDTAAAALATLPDPVTRKDAEQFCVDNGLSVEALMNLMGGSP